MGKPAKFVVHQRYQPVERLLIAFAPLAKQTCDVRR
jgi:hypothetical protein